MPSNPSPSESAADAVLLIEDDPRLADLLQTYLGGRGFRVIHRGAGRPGMDTLAELTRAGQMPSMVLLDVMLPDSDGFELCREIRASTLYGNVPIIMLTARGDAMDRIVGLELGADDYLPKPFNPRELLARMKAIGRRQARGTVQSTGAAATGADVLTFGRLSIDRTRREVRLAGAEQRLTAHQFDLLWALATRPGRVLSREQLMHWVRNTSLEAFDRSIDVHISRIRQAIEDDPKVPRRIKTVRGAGYVFVAEQE